MSAWNDPELRNLFFRETHLIDVRAPVEFAEGSIPGSINLPIMTDDERAQVGTCYKLKGQAAAIELGHQLVSGPVKETRIKAWTDAIKARPETQIFCFRGGLRSQITCQWIREAGIEKYPIQGGYKRLRAFFHSFLQEAPLPPMLRIAGPTGSGKTDFLQRFEAAVDLERLANHRGSAFGDLGRQPSQVRFENELSLTLMKAKGKAIVEDESYLIGRVSLPKRFYDHLRNSPLVVLDVPLEVRVENILRDYVLKRDEDFFLRNLERISKKLGGLRYQQIHNEIQRGYRTGEHAEWIALLLTHYYDPMYLNDLQRQPGQIAFRGAAAEAERFLRSEIG